MSDVIGAIIEMAKIRANDEEFEIELHKDGPKWSALYENDEESYEVQGFSRVDVLRGVRELAEGRPAYSTYLSTLPLDDDGKSRHREAQFVQHCRAHYHWPQRVRLSTLASAEKFIPSHKKVWNPAAGRKDKESNKISGGKMTTEERRMIPRLGQPPAPIYLELDGKKLFIKRSESHFLDDDEAMRDAYTAEKGVEVTAQTTHATSHYICSRCAAWAVSEGGDAESQTWTGPLAQFNQFCNKAKQKAAKRERRTKLDVKALRYKEEEAAAHDTDRKSINDGTKLVSDKAEDIQQMFRERDRDTTYGVNYQWRLKAKGFKPDQFATVTDMVRNLVSRGLTGPQIRFLLNELEIKVSYSTIYNASHIKADTGPVDKSINKAALIRAIYNAGVHDPKTIHNAIIQKVKGCGDLTYQYVYQQVRRLQSE